MKIYANNFDFLIHFTCRAGTSSRYSTGEIPPNKAGEPGLCMRLRQHIYEDLNESSSASPEGSQQLEIPPSPNSKRAANFFQIRWFFTRRGHFNTRQDSIVRLYFCETLTFYKPAYFSVRCQYFPNPPIFL